MKKNLTTLFIAAAAVVTLAAGCKGKDKVANDPKTVLTAFFERMSNKDIDGAAKLATKESKGTLDMMKKAMDASKKMGKMSESPKDDPSEGFKKMKIGDAKIDGDNATVSVSNPSKDDKVVDFPLKKEDGDWKVDFSMGTLMKMGMDQAKEKGDMNNPFNGSDTAGMSDKMNNLMNGDSLKKGMELLDSALKKLDPEKMKEMKDALKNLDKLNEH